MIRGSFSTGSVGRMGVVFVGAALVTVGVDNLVAALVTVGVDNLVVLTIVLVAVVGSVDARVGVGLGVV